jgi:integrase
MVWQDLGLIFTTEIGTPLPGNTTHTHFHRHLAEAGLPHIRIHDLRHTFATLLFGLGVHSGYVQHALGHSSASFTQDIYSHYLPEMGVAVSDAMDSILEAGKGRSAVNRAVQEPVNLRSAAKSQGKHT